MSKQARLPGMSPEEVAGVHLAKCKIALANTPSEPIAPTEVPYVDPSTCTHKFSDALGMPICIHCNAFKPEPEVSL